MCWFLYQTEDFNINLFFYCKIIKLTSLSCLSNFFFKVFITNCRSILSFY